MRLEGEKPENIVCQREPRDKKCLMKGLSLSALLMVQIGRVR